MYAFFNVVPQDKRHSWYTVHSEELAVAFCSRCEGSLSNESVVIWCTFDAVFCENALCQVSRHELEVEER